METSYAICKGKDVREDMKAGAATIRNCISSARGKPVICFAHVTNQMGQIEGDFEKGQADGTTDALRIVVKAAQRLIGTDEGSFGQDQATQPHK